MHVKQNNKTCKTAITKLFLYLIVCLSVINARDIPTGQSKWTIQRNWHMGYTRRRQIKHKHNAICVWQRYPQVNTNNLNKTWSLILATRGKDEINMHCGNCNGHHYTELRQINWHYKKNNKKKIINADTTKNNRGWNVKLNSIFYVMHFLLIRFNKLLKNMINKWLIGTYIAKCMMKIPNC